MHNYSANRYPTDTHSFAKPTEAVVKHLELDLDVNLTNKSISGTATYTVTASQNAAEIIFDTKDLVIESVLLENGQAADFTLGEEKLYLGIPLHISIPQHTTKLSIHYKTTAKSAALQWLAPEQTGGKQHPFLFTQSQAILARSWLPCQDSPGIRFTYNAQVKVPVGYLALMSALNPQEKSLDGTYNFSMTKPIPSYLMALAVGDLEFKPISGTTGVYAEPAQLEQAYQEFTELPEMLAVAENIYGKYSWDRYDLLLLPPSFPFGGMENPMLTFVTPTIIAGDRSLTSLVAHELAHSWSGNLVTNATWNDFWLNEGFTVYFERRIMEALHGQDYADMLKVLGYQDLQHTLEEIGHSSKDTCLKLDLTNRDPDEGLTEIAYEKGNLFLLAIEATVGREIFDQFVKGYFKDFAFQSMTTEKFIAYLEAKLLPPDSPYSKIINPEEWIYQPGLPITGPVITSNRFEKVQEQVTLWLNTTPANALKTENWSTHEWLYFLNGVSSQLTYGRMAELDQTFNFTDSGNAEILAVWLHEAIKQEYLPAEAVLENFLLHVGRRKFLVPLYKALREQNPEQAKSIYTKARANYHAVATSTLDALLF
ncbi:M1 family metallopeptidase [Adhaeribacter aquaticus]|uniref:M1 family metallopeptidase n=1 Tax=Adhaeribacter aquaticus TaxID=299567 RepID=UPI0005575B4F|nr:M1 family metallopeptidase [Adhaeribacter aquaticus]